MLLPYLADEETTDLSDEGFPGCVAVWRPMDLLDKAKWADKCHQLRVATDSAQAKYVAVKQQLLRIEGLKVQETKGGPEVPFEVDKHFDRVGLSILIPIHTALEDRSLLSEIDLKNFARPSASSVPSGTANSPVEDVAKDNETPSGAFSQDTNENLQKSLISTP